MARIIDLDVLLDPPKKVKLGGKTYLLPSDIPMPLYLGVQARQADSENADLLMDLHQQVLELFQVHQPEMTVVPVGMRQLFEVIPAIYGAEKSAEGESTGASGGRRNSTPKPRPRKRSRS